MGKDNSGDGPPKDNLIPFPGRESVDPKEVGIDSYYAMPVGSVPQGELMDPRAIAMELQERREYVDGQSLVIISKEGAPTASTIDAILVEIAEEMAHLKWERRNLAKKGKSTAQLTIARVTGLKQLTDILIKRKETSLNERISMKDPRIQKLLEMFMEMFYSACEKCSVSPEVIDLIFSQIKTDMVDWETKMEEVNKS